jgi:hypothetical protein
MNTTSRSRPLFGSRNVSFRSWKSLVVSFNTSLILMPPLAINSRINRFRIFAERKMISSTESFSMMFQLVVIFGRNSFLSIDELQGF